MPTRPPLFRPRGAPSRAEANRTYNRTRRTDPRTALIEKWRASRRWRKVRELKLAQDPLCELCEERGRTTPARQVHHLKPVRSHPELGLVLENLFACCQSCHGIIEAGG